MSDATLPVLCPRCPLCGETAAAPLVSFAELSFVRCGGCAVVYKRAQAEGLGQRYERAYFEEGSARYTRRWEHRVAKCRRQLLACLEFVPAARDVLDLGCSVGYVLEAAKRLGLRGAGVDLSAFAVEACTKRGFEAHVGPLEALPVGDASFDVVTAKHTLEHTERPLEALAEIRRVLRPGGVAFLVVPDAAYWKRYVMPRRGGYFRPDRAGWQHHVYYAEAHLADACRRAGLAPLRAGKAIYRRRLARGAGAIWEPLRFAALAAWTGAAGALHLRREIQLVARRP